MLVFGSATSLSVKLDADLLQKLGQAAARRLARRHATVGVVHDEVCCRRGRSGRTVAASSTMVLLI